MTTLPFDLYLDLDGVLADFDKRVRELTGKSPDEQPSRDMWRTISRTQHDFYNSLDFMPDGQVLWNATKDYNPTILTGLPIGNWAAPQKRTWCARMLGPDVPVITCMARDKHNHCSPGAVLIDDREKARDPWVAKGGFFILHTSAASSLAQLNEYIAAFQTV